MAAERPSVAGVVIGTWQQAVRSDLGGGGLDSEANAAVDMALSLPVGAGALELELKGSSTPPRNGVSSVLAVANASVGESVGSDERGRIVPWQAFYRHPAGNGSVAVGLLDVTGWLDGNDVASDEFTQFLGASFVHNPTIDLPSASFGAAYNVGLGRGFGLAAVAVNATGVEPRYRTAFLPARHGNGLFGALELQWSGSGLAANLGAWVNSRHHDDDGDGVDDERLAKGRARGLYGNLSGSAAGGQWNLRLGWADPRVQAPARFAAVAYSHPFGKAVVGAAAGRTFPSNRLPGPHGALTQAEVYVRFPVYRSVTLTADLQHIAHAGFDPAQTGDWVMGVRMGWSF
ncbi:MAG: hypothetical protein P8124_00865 [Gammaproteobacteria bacterium]